MVNLNIIPRPLTEQEWADRKKDVYDSFANYLVFCPKCGKMAKTNMYIMCAETYAEDLNKAGKACDCCGSKEWIVGYPKNSTTGFKEFNLT